jgi:hypothetical protein
MIESHRSDPTFKPVYSHTYRDSGESVDAPFAVAVFGVGTPEPFLGVGKVVGSIELGDFDSDHPVIEVEDVEDGQPYTVLGCESWWRWPIPEEVVDGMSSGQLATDSVRKYIFDMRAREALSDIEDDAWLEDNGINPETETE